MPFEPTCHSKRHRNKEFPNPFATRFVKPGALEFRSTSAVNVDELEERWRRHLKQASIVGPHGCGKSTLIHELTRRVSEAGGQVESFIFRKPNASTKNRRCLRELISCLRRLTAQQLQNQTIAVTIDGLEQLNVWQRYAIYRQAKNSDVLLLVSSHSRSRFPLLCELKSDDTSWQAAVESLRGSVANYLQARVDLESNQGASEMALFWRDFEALTKRESKADESSQSVSTRERFFQLYDQWERLRASAT